MLSISFSIDGAEREELLRALTDSARDIHSETWHYRSGLSYLPESVKNAQPLEEAAQMALQQIEKKRHQTELEQHRLEGIIKIGLAFSGKHVAMRSEGSAQ